MDWLGLIGSRDYCGIACEKLPVTWTSQHWFSEFYVLQQGKGKASSLKYNRKEVSEAPSKTVKRGSSAVHPKIGCKALWIHLDSLLIATRLQLRWFPCYKLLKLEARAWAPHGYSLTEVTTIRQQRPLGVRLHTQNEFESHSSAVWYLHSLRPKFYSSAVVNSKGLSHTFG